MLFRTLSLSQNQASENTPSKTSLFRRILSWRWMSIPALGITANLLINAVLDYKYQRPLVSFSLEEYFNAIIGAFVFLKGTRWISSQLDKRLPWANGVRKRLLSELSLQLVFIIIALNALIISITYFIYDGFYSFSDLMLINISVVSITFFFSSIDTGIYFYRNWAGASGKNKGNSASSELKKPIQISLGKVRHQVPQQEIQCAVSEAGSAVIITREDRKLVYSESLDSLMKNLDPQEFFRANRQTIVHYTLVKSVKPLEHGKVEAHLQLTNGQAQQVVVSRTKAAEFRKWLKSQSA